jgi:hypothetical protein
LRSYLQVRRASSRGTRHIQVSECEPPLPVIGPRADRRDDGEPLKPLLASDASRLVEQSSAETGVLGCPLLPGPQLQRRAIDVHLAHHGAAAQLGDRWFGLRQRKT